MIKYRTLTTVSIDYSLRQSVGRYDFDTILECENVGIGIEMFNGALVSLSSLHCPVKSKNISYKDDLKLCIDAVTNEKIKKLQNYYLLVITEV